ncbi:hypothetical protein B566_EDAN004143 [Ephemera danica]|nr:hypothetical protein B566_EDAN004143 [Ephemera danica]
MLLTTSTLTMENDKENEAAPSASVICWADELVGHDDSSNASSAALEIVAPTASTSTPSKKRGLAVNMPEGLESLENEIEEQLGLKAKRSKLTVANVKNILRHVITNHHVMAMVKKSMKDCGEVGSSDDEFPYEPKLTRAKTKELLQSHTNIPWPVTPSKAPPASETKKLIDAVLPDEEDDDEEYQPNYDEEVSEDEGASMASDLEAALTPQPATPRSNADCSTQTNESNWAPEGYFKVPGEPGAGVENIGQRTRSKLCLSNTALETIEQSFIPPDITTDMYDVECDNEDWRNFLTEFTRPLTSVVNETLDDDEADPEYNILEDEEAEDHEELRADRAVKVSKKELNELISELVEFLESSDDELEPGNESLSSSMQLLNSTIQDTLNSTMNETSAQQPVNECSFAALRISNRQTVMMLPNTTINNVTTPTHQDLAMLLLQSSPQTPQYQVQTPNMTPLLSTPQTTVTPLRGEQSPPRSPVPVREGQSSEQFITPDHVTQPAEHEDEFVLPDRIVRMTESATGTVQVTYEQRMLIAQQMRQHVQLLAQSYMQSVIIPEMHCCATETKENLNLDGAIAAVNEWDSYLKEDNPKSVEMKRFIQEEKDRMADRRRRKLKFEPRHSKLFLDLVCSNRAFMYPLLLPTTAFKSRCDVPNKLYFAQSETVLLVYGLEQFIPYVERNVDFHSKKKQVTVQKVADLISEFLLPAKTSRAIQFYIARLKCLASEDNPIQRFFLRNELPKTDHYVITCKPTPPAQQPLELLPLIFRQHLTREEPTV